VLTSAAGVEVALDDEHVVALVSTAGIMEVLTGSDCEIAKKTGELFGLRETHHRICLLCTSLLPAVHGNCLPQLLRARSCCVC
jgi:hypothetical protein